MLASVLLATALAAPPSPELANLRVISQPGVNVVWEGVLLGEVDEGGELLVERIPPGVYTIVLQKDGYREQRFDIAVEGGRTTDLTARLAREVKELAVSEVPIPDRGTVGTEPPELRSEVGTSGTETPDEEGESTLERERAEPAGNVEQGSLEEAAPAAAAGDPSGDQETEETTPEGDLIGQESSLERALPVPASGASDVVPDVRLVLLMAVVAMALAIAAWLALRGRRLATAPITEPVSQPAFHEVKQVSKSASEPTFIEDLRRREKDMSTSRPRRAKVPREDVIDVEFSEIADLAEGD